MNILYFINLQNIASLPKKQDYVTNYDVFKFYICTIVYLL